MIIYEKNGVRIVPAVQAYLPELWDILQEHKNPESFFADNVNISDADLFVEWFGKEAIEPLVGLDEDNVVGMAWLDLLYPNHSASINILKKRNYLNPELIAAIFKAGLPYYFEKYNLEKMNGYPRVDNQACINMLLLIGLKIDGTIRHHKKVNGEWTDYLITSILREELYHANL